MKKFLFTMMAALLVCGMSFAQPKAKGTAIKLDNPQTASAEKSGWVGNVSSATSLFTGVIENGAVAILPKTLNADMTGQITKVKYYHYLPEGYENNSFVLEIYDDVALTGDYADNSYYDINWGTPSYTQNVTLTDQGWVEIELTTPYEIPSTEFAVVLHSNGTNPFILGAVDATTENAYLFQYHVNVEGVVDDDFWTTPEMTDGLHTIAMGVFVEDDVVYQEQADLEVWFGDKKPGSSGINEIDEISIGEGDDLVIYPFFSNNGPDAITSSTCHVTLDVIIGGETINLLDENEDFSEDPFPNGYYFYYEAEGHVFGADQIALYEVTEFQVVAKAEDIENDPDETNNIDTLTVIITHPNPVQNLVATPEGANVVLTWEAPEPCEGLSLGGYKIYRDGAQVGMKPAGTETYTQNDVPDGTYEYCVVAVYNQTVLSEEVCVEATADGINEMAENIAVYPNPATTALKVANVEGANILVINSLGQIVANIENAKEMQEINVEGLAEGIYTVRIANETGVVTKQFCVKK